MAEKTKTFDGVLNNLLLKKKTCKTKSQVCRNSIITSNENSCAARKNVAKIYNKFGILWKTILRASHHSVLISTAVIGAKSQGTSICGSV